MMYNKKQNILIQFNSIKNYFAPKIVGEMNDVFIKLAKIKGQEVPWHTHDYEDELFYIIKGSLTMELKGKDNTILCEGDFFIVEKGIEHRVQSETECWLMLIENNNTKHTGNVVSKITKPLSDQHY